MSDAGAAAGAGDLESEDCLLAMVVAPDWRTEVKDLPSLKYRIYGRARKLGLLGAQDRKIGRGARLTRSLKPLLRRYDTRH